MIIPEVRINFHFKPSKLGSILRKDIRNLHNSGLHRLNAVPCARSHHREIKIYIY